METASKRAMIDLLIEEIGNQGAVVLCTSNRAAAIVRRQMLGRIQSGAIMDIEVISVNGLVAELTRELGIEANVIGGLGREMVVSEVLAAKKAPSGLKDIRIPDYARTISAAIAELIASGVKADEIRGLAENSSKIGILSSAYEGYLERLESARAIDSKQLPDVVIKRILSPGAFFSLNRKKVIRYCIPPDMLADKLIAGLKAAGINVIEIEPPKERQIGFRQLKMVHARQGRQLAREAARECKRLAHETSCKYGDICIIVPPVPGSEREVVHALEWAGIPSLDPLWMDLSEHPAASSMISAMKLISSFESKVDIFPFCASPYFGMDYFGRQKGKACSDASKSSMASRMQSLLRRRSEVLPLKDWANPSLWNKYFGKVDSSDHELDNIRGKFHEWSKLMLEWCRELNREGSWDDHCRNLERLAGEFYTGRGLLGNELLNPDQAALEMKALDAIRDVIDKVRYAFQLTGKNSKKVGWSEFASTIGEAFREKRLMIRGASRAGVAIAEPKDAIGAQFPHVLVFEVSEKRYPCPYSPGWILSENDRQRIDGLNNGDADARRLQEKSHFFTAVAAASDTLTFLIPSIGTDEKEINESIWVADIEKMAAEAQTAIKKEYVKRRYPAPNLEKDCVTEQEVILNRDDAASTLHGAEETALLGLKQINSEDKERLAEVSKARFNSEYAWSASMIGQFLRCGASFVPIYLADIRQKEEYEELPSAMAAGSFIHAMAKAAFEKAASLKGQPLEEARKELRCFIEAQFDYGRTGLSFNTTESLWVLLKAQYLSIIMQFAESELEYMNGPGRSFCIHENEQPMSTSQGNGTLRIGNTDISFSARLDRVDVDCEGNAAVYDYKSGSIPSPAADVQVDFYSLIVKQCKGYFPVASAYFPLSKKENTRAEIDTGSYVEEHSENLCFKGVKEDSKKLLSYPKAEAQARWQEAGERIEEIVKKILSGNFYEEGLKKEKPCTNCIRKYICWDPDSRKGGWW